MRPVAQKYFGANGIPVRFYNGTTAVPGWIVRQIGTKKYIVTDGTVTKAVSLTSDHDSAVLLATNGADYSSVANLATIVATDGTNTFYVSRLLRDLASTTADTSTSWTMIDAQIVFGNGTIAVTVTTTPTTPSDPGTPSVPALALTFNDQTPLQFSDGSYLEFAS